MSPSLSKNRMVAIADAETRFQGTFGVVRFFHHDENESRDNPIPDKSVWPAFIFENLKSFETNQAHLSKYVPSTAIVAVDALNKRIRNRKERQEDSRRVAFVLGSRCPTRLIVEDDDNMEFIAGTLSMPSDSMLEVNNDDIVSAFRQAAGVLTGQTLERVPTGSYMDDAHEEFSSNRLCYYNIDVLHDDGKTISVPWPALHIRKLGYFTSELAKREGEAVNVLKLMQEEMAVMNQVVGRGTGVYLLGTPPTAGKEKIVVFQATRAGCMSGLSSHAKAMAISGYGMATDELLSLVFGKSRSRKQSSTISSYSARNTGRDSKLPLPRVEEPPSAGTKRKSTGVADGTNHGDSKPKKTKKKAKRVGIPVAKSIGVADGTNHGDSKPKKVKKKAKRVEIPVAVEAKKPSLLKEFRSEVINELPQFSQVREALGKAGHEFDGGRFVIPGIVDLSSEDEYRAFLCKHGIPIKQNSRRLLQDDSFQPAKAWVSYYWSAKYLKETGFSIDPKAPKLTSNEFVDMLRNKLKIEIANGEWVYPGDSPDAAGPAVRPDYEFETKVSRKGIPKHLMDKSGMSDQEKIAFYVYLCCPVRRDEKQGFRYDPPRQL